MAYEVEDLIENLMTGGIGSMFWAAFLPITNRLICDCFGRDGMDQCACRCVYDDFENSLVGMDPESLSVLRQPVVGRITSVLFDGQLSWLLSSRYRPRMV
ncbi:uncharacterized protein LY89DRAFT_54330 [Mollisia scopiformis]|uniref:Uncharacterized protein n=1 Tax=Mollisia scopiformis TaxID=149040 RepID=A0A194XCJ7_MOLSC|nr:uncharacterized protein LY89DRAFT_54330 [Mollisia scopiformis]KUJ17472.1 hypothetical protein LY89DRAFT_54330 [Mollisia scopiformis]